MARQPLNDDQLCNVLLQGPAWALGGTKMEAVFRRERERQGPCILVDRDSPAEVLGALRELGHCHHLTREGRGDPEVLWEIGDDASGDLAVALLLDPDGLPQAIQASRLRTSEVLFRCVGGDPAKVQRALDSFHAWQASEPDT